MIRHKSLLNLLHNPTITTLGLHQNFLTVHIIILVSLVRTKVKRLDMCSISLISHPTIPANKFPPHTRFLSFTQPYCRTITRVRHFKHDTTICTRSSIFINAFLSPKNFFQGSQDIVHFL